MPRRSRRDDDLEAIKAKTVMPEEGDMFGFVIRRLGGMWLEVQCSDGKIRKVRIPGKMKRIRIFDGDLILITPWYGITEEKADVKHKYFPNEVRILLKTKHRETIEKLLPPEVLENYLS
ncbi:MAG: hypothetical protein ACP6IP_07415 [Candidatus Njordarchaeia archaeon]